VVVKIHNITIPVEKASVFETKSAYLEAFFQKIAGTAVMEVFFGMEGFPRSDDMFFVAGENDVIFEKDTFFRDDASAV
jgi:hypothetical protein